MSRLLENGLKNVNPRGYQGGQEWLWWALTQARLRSDYGDMAPTTESEAVRAVADAETVLGLLVPLAAPGTAPEG
jgi:hypothetical protein